MIISKEYPVAAFSEGLRANRGYLVFAALAEKEGYPEIARLFRATAQEETVQAYAHLRDPRRIRNTGENFWGGTSGGNPEAQKISPLMLVAAVEEGWKKPPRSPNFADGKEKTPTAPFRKALARLAELGKGDYYVCSECGHANTRKRPEKCPHCQSKDITLVKVG